MFKNFLTKSQDYNYKNITITPYKLDKERYYNKQNKQIIKLDSNCYHLLTYNFKF